MVVIFILKCLCRIALKQITGRQKKLKEKGKVKKKMRDG